MQPARIFGLDVVRATAIGLVLFGHTIQALHLAPVSSDDAITLLGVLGVELFFVLSGFLIGRILLRQLSSETWDTSAVGRFLVRRWLRTLPNYYVYLALHLALAVALGDALTGAKRSALFLQNLAWPHPDFFAVSWSLAIEEWFYLLLPLGLLVLGRLGMSAERALLCCAATLMVLPLVLRLGLAGDPALHWDAHVRKVVVLRLDALMFGVFAAYLRQRRPAWWEGAARPCLGLGLSLMVLGGVWFLGSAPEGLFRKALMFSLFPLSVALVLPWAETLRGRRGLVSHCVSRLSLWSYSLYLCHSPLLRGFAWLAERLEVRSGAGKSWIVVGFAVSAGLVAYASYRFVELPFLRHRDARWRANQRLT